VAGRRYATAANVVDGRFPGPVILVATLSMVEESLLYPGIPSTILVTRGGRPARAPVHRRRTQVLA
jgi:hypothetical protein